SSGHGLVGGLRKNERRSRASTFAGTAGIIDCLNFYWSQRAVINGQFINCPEKALYDIVSARSDGNAARKGKNGIVWRCDKNFPIDVKHYVGAGFCNSDMVPSRVSNGPVG